MYNGPKGAKHDKSLARVQQSGRQCIVSMWLSILACLETLRGAQSLKETLRTLVARPSRKQDLGLHHSKVPQLNYQRRKVYGGIYGNSWTTSIHSLSSQIQQNELRYQGLRGSLIHENLRVLKHSTTSNKGCHITIWEESKVVVQSYLWKEVTAQMIFPQPNHT